VFLKGVIESRDAFEGQLPGYFPGDLAMLARRHLKISV